jgi:N-formylglutamate deformylase
MDYVASTLKQLGHSVSINFPYYGGELIRRHSDPANGIESIFIEVNKKLFIDTKTFKKTDGYPALKDSIDQLLVAIVDYARSKPHQE